MGPGNDKATGARPALADLLRSIDRKHRPPEAGREERGQHQRADRQIELIPVARLIACKTNARTHSPKQIRQIAASIKHFGFTVPVLVNDQNEILAGHGRVEAAKLLGLTQVPVLRLSHLSAAEQRAYVIADNRLAELASWDRHTLAIELDALVELDFAVELTGFDVPEIDLILQHQDEDKDENENGNESTGAEAKSPKANSGPPVSRDGDVWLLGAHKLVCGDSPDERAYAALDAALRRWQAFTGQSATLAGSGVTFKKIAQERRKSAPARRTRRPAAVQQTPEAA
jgi:hypothetical protein